MVTIDYITANTALAKVFHRGDWKLSLEATINYDGSAELVLSTYDLSPIFRHVPEFNPQAVVDIVIDADIYDNLDALRTDTDNIFDELNRQLFA